MASDEPLLTAYIKIHEKETVCKFDGDIGKLQDFMKDVSGGKLQAHPNCSLELVIDVTNDIYDLIRQMNWLFVIAPKDTSFILSDHPFSLFHPVTVNLPSRPIGLAMRETEIQVPLTPEICLVGSWNDLYRLTKPLPATKRMIDDINDVIQANAVRYIYSREKIVGRPDRALAKRDDNE